MICERRTIFRCICDRRRSRYRYRSRVSSGASSSGKMLNGSGSALPRTSNASISTSTSPVSSFGLTFSVGLSGDLPVDPEDRLLGVAAHLVRERGVGPDHELRDPVMVPQVEEEHAPQVPLVVEPARQSDHLTLVALPQFPAGMRSEFLHVDPFRDAEPLLQTSERATRPCVQDWTGRAVPDRPPGRDDGGRRRRHARSSRRPPPEIPRVTGGPDREQPGRRGRERSFAETSRRVQPSPPRAGRVRGGASGSRPRKGPAPAGTPRPHLPP